jgi:hypothetical protein
MEVHSRITGKEAYPMELLSQEVLDRIPQLGTMDEDDPMVWARVFNPASGCRWYIIALEPLVMDGICYGYMVGWDMDGICYGYMVGWDEELTYFNLSDLDLHAAELGEANQFDATFVPCRLSEVQKRERGG